MAEEGVDMELIDDISPFNDDMHLVVEHSTQKETVTQYKGPLVNWMRINITHTDKKNISLAKKQDAFVVYCIETSVAGGSNNIDDRVATSVWRRYSDFELLHNYLEVIFPWVVIPTLPEKRVTHTGTHTSVDRFHPSFIERRRCGLERFLLRCAAHPQLCQDAIFVHFLQQEYGWRDVLNEAEFHSKAEPRLKKLGAQLRLRKSDRRFDDLKNYSTELQSSIGNILKIRARMCEKLYGVHKLHGNYARVLRELSEFEKGSAEHLQNASHYMDVYSTAVGTHLEESEHFADQLKEYHAFGECLKSVCSRYECAQYDVERAEDNLAGKMHHKGSLANNTGKSGFSLSGMKTKLFGSDTPEQKEAKLKQLDEQILLVESELSQLQKQCILFTDAALEDIKRFQEQKDKDLQQVLLSYAELQVKHCKQGIAAWTGMRDSFSQM